MRTSDRQINPILKTRIIKTFAQTISDLKTPENLEVFLEDFFNKSELETFAKRLAVAYWLKKARSYTNIKENLKVSSATIASIQNLAKTKGFTKAIKLMEAEEWANVWEQKIKGILKK